MDFFEAEDYDKSFSYNTRQQVNIQDRYLGLTNICLTLVILFYIILGIFYFDKGYLDIEVATGGIATHVRGDALAVSSGKPGSRYFSAEELIHPGLENGNIFVATRQSVWKQKRGICEDRTSICYTDADCTPGVNGKCTDKGYCLEPSWCNEEEKGYIYELDVGDLVIWVRSSIQFVKLAPDKIYTTEYSHPYPMEGHNSFSVRDLLMMCEPVPVRYEEISELGAIIEVQVLWECNVRKDTCKPTVKARRIDVELDPFNIGYSFNYPEYLGLGKNERHLNKMQGVRIFLRSVGVGRKFSVNALIMKASTAATLLSIAPIIADLMMLTLFAKKKKYYAAKYEVSPDFSEYMDGLKKKKAELAEEELGENIENDDLSFQEKDDEWQRRIDEEDVH